MRRVSIDTNVYVAFKTNRHEIVEAFRQLDFIGIDVAVLGELLAGFRLGKREAENRAALETFLDSPRVNLLLHEADTAEYFASVYRNLRSKGRPIPTNDIWIAAGAMQRGLALFTLDRHFEAIDGLILKKD